MQKEIVISMIVALFLICCSGRRLANIGLSNKKLTPCPDSPNCVSSFDADTEHFVAPLSYNNTKPEAFAKLRKVLSEMKRTVIITEKEDYIHAEATSFFFRFTDDIEFYFSDSGKIIHVRSASRIGHSDLGVNRSRVEKIRKKFSGQ